jgi:hypothetical protein
MELLKKELRSFFSNFRTDYQSSGQQKGGCRMVWKF